MARTILETPRLVLREVTPADIDFLAAMMADPEVMRFYRAPYSRAEVEAWIATQLGRYAADGYGSWLVLEKASGKPVGRVGLCRWTIDGADEDEIGYMIDRPFWRRGYASEAAAGVRDFAFGPLGKRRVISLVRPVNVPSQGVARKLGLAPEKVILWRELEHIVFALQQPAGS